MRIVKKLENHTCTCDHREIGKEMDVEELRDSVKEWIRHSVEEVVKKLPRKVQTEYYENSEISFIFAS